MKKTIYFENAGVPETGLSPVWDTLKYIDGTDFSPQPSITELGGGHYVFDIETDEVIVGTVDGTATLADADRYVPFIYDPKEDKYDIIIVPSYNESTTAITFLVFVLRNGRIVTDFLENCDLNAYNSNHTLLYNVTSSVETNGVFVLTKSNPSITINQPYYVQATITINGVDYNSIDTYISLE